MTSVYRWPNKQELKVYILNTIAITSFLTKCLNVAFVIPRNRMPPAYCCHHMALANKFIPMSKAHYTNRNGPEKFGKVKPRALNVNSFNLSNVSK